MSLTGDEATERRCRALAASVKLPQPFTVPGLLESVAQMTGKRVISAPPPSMGLTVSGCTEHLGDAFRVQHPDGDDTWSLLVTCHEVGHILADHLLPPGPAVRRKHESSTELSHFSEHPWLDYACRSDCSDQNEREAETFAALLVSRITEQINEEQRWVTRKAVTPTQRRVIGRFEDILGGRTRGDG
ncbi:MULTISPECIES: hypothetical protein [Actinomycetes]|uniref:IrrE N-terminal-like domain-containing protein n=1 Tax=Quadrisphaera setariae TaxID=2593304 RepID=A0A5C8Z5C7_9ACTN|nr:MULTISPECIES: hypothetical protein [Actinomycetes]TNM60399.1 hypothetical protein FHN55_18400 [Streptomyces sp. NP160]TXR52473.1 hypothetical protein FMM08_19985 [Quadrisphaera setariae]